MPGDTHYIVGGGDCGFVRIIDCRLCFFVPTQETTKLMLTVVALTMALTPFMEEIGASKGQHHHTMATA